MDRLTNGGGTWPEQEIVSAWLAKYGILIPFKQQLDLQEQLTKLRQSLSQEAVRDEVLEAERILKIISELEVTEQGVYTNAGKVMRQMARNYFALKREPNAAGGASDD